MGRCDELGAGDLEGSAARVRPEVRVSKGNACLAPLPLLAWIAAGALGISACAAGESQGMPDATVDVVSVDTGPLGDAGRDAAVGPDARDGDAASVDAADVPIVDASRDASAETGPVDAAPCGPMTESCATGCCAVSPVDLSTICSYPSVAVDPAGYIYVSCTLVASSPERTGLVRFDPTTSMWSTESLTGGSFRSVVRVDSTGRVHQLWGADSAALTYRFSDDHGVTWTTHPLPSPLANAGSADLAVGPDGTPHVVWLTPSSSSAGGFGQAMNYATWTGFTWTLSVLDNVNEDVDPKIALDASGHPHVLLWTYGRSVRVFMQHMFYDGATWHGETIDSGASAYGSNVEGTPYDSGQIEVLADGSVRAVYFRSLSGASGDATLVVATRPPGATSTWTLTPVMGPTGSFADATYFANVAGAPAILTGGLTTYRRAEATDVFVGMPTGLAGVQPGAAVLGGTLYVAYTNNPSGGHLFFSRVTP